MGLRAKAWLFFGIGFMGLVLAVLLILKLGVLRSFSRFEEAALRRDVERALRAVDAEAAHLETTVVDWAEWTSSYDFVATGDDTFVSENLTEDTFRSLGLSLIAFVKRGGELSYGGVYDPTSRLVAEPSSAMTRLLAEKVEAIDDFHPKAGLRGVCLFPDRPRLIAAWPIRRSDNSGLPPGILVMGKNFDTEVLLHLGAALDLDLSARRLTELPPGSDFAAAAAHFDSGHRIVTAPPADETVSGFGLVVDTHGRPAMVLRVTQQRTITAQGRAVARYLLLSLLAALAISALAVQLLIERGVISRLAALGTRMREIGRLADPSARVSMSGGDEVSQLAGGINSMLSALQSAEASVHESEERYRAIVEGQTELICRWRPASGELLFANRAFRRAFGPPEGQPVGGSVAAVLEDAPASLAPAVQGLTRDEPVVTLVLAHPRGGVTRWVQWSNRGIFAGGGELLEIQSVGRDVTRQRAFEEALSRCEREAREVLQGPHEVSLLTDLGGTVLASNHASASRLEITLVTLVGSRIIDVMGPDGAARWRVSAEQAIATGEPAIYEEQRAGRTFLIAIMPTPREPGLADQLATIGHDVTDMRRAEQAERQLLLANRRADALERLSRDLAGRVLAGSSTFERIAELVARELGDLCLIHVLAAADRLLLPVAVHHRDRTVNARLHRRGRLAPVPLACGIAQQALDEGRAIVLAAADPLDLAASVAPELEAYLARFSAVGAIVAPIALGGKAAGLLCVIREPDSAPIADDEVAFATELAARAGLAIGQMNLANELQGELRERARVEEALRDAQEAFLQVSRSVNGVVWIREIASQRVSYVSPGFEHIWGRTCESLYADATSYLAGIHPDDRGLLPVGTPDSADARVDVELRVVRPDGYQRWVRLRQFRLAGTTEDGGKVISFTEDISDRKAMEEESRRLEAQLRLLARRLDEAREEERRKLSVWIHDEIGQMLTALRMDLTWLHKRLHPRAPELQATFAEMDAMIARNVTAVQHVCTELRPAVLADLGPVAAIEWLVEQFRRRSNFKIEFAAHADDRQIPENVSLALFRIVQEALTNIARHAGATTARVELGADHNEVSLRVSDNGRGVHPEEVSGAAALGILGMRERVLAVGGLLVIGPGAGGGTVLTATIPRI